MKVYSTLFAGLAIAVASLVGVASLSAQSETAVYNSTLKAPECATVGSSCDSGPSLLLGRDTMSGGAEPNQPNTINSSCADGKSGTFHSAESNDRIVVASTNGGVLTQGNQVTVTATVWTYATSGSSEDYLDIYYTANASTPSWVLVKTIAPTTTGASTLSTSYTLPAGTLQAVRANFRSGGSAAVCTTGSYDDHDDLIFAVQSAGTSSFSLSATAASVTDGSTGTSTVTESISNGFSSPVTLSASGLPTGVTAAFSPTSITGAGTSTLTFTASSTATPGNYTVTVTGTPATGTAQTTTLTLTVSAETSTSYTLIAEPAAGLTPIYNLISSAKKTIDITMYALQDTTFTSLLATAAADGVTVRVILDQNAEKSNNTTAYNYLTANNVSVHWANPTYTYTHQKTITVDGTTSSIQTLNLQSQYYATSREYAVITNDALDVAAIETTFNADFVNGTITPPDGDNLVWSPTNSRSALLALINGATTSLMIEQEEMADTGIESALESALARGVAITLVQENESSDYNTILTTLKNDGAKIAVYTSSTGYYIHAKVVLADYGTSEAKLFVGSENFSTNSLNNNRELGLIFSDPASITAIEPDIVSDYNGGTKY
ncbi:MAG: phospholipase D-like domain-containing protein [Terracidiphilus sp.]|jgi:hypothetical protein